MRFLSRRARSIYRFISLIIGIFALNRTASTVEAQNYGYCYVCELTTCLGCTGGEMYCYNIAFGASPDGRTTGYSGCLTDGSTFCNTFGAPCSTVS
jgi:hypothetical protein